MGGVMTQQFQGLLIPGGDDGHLGVGGDEKGGVHQSAIHPASEGDAGEALSDVGGNLGHGHRLGEGADGTVGKGDLGHGPGASSVVIDTRDHVIELVANNAEPAAETK